MFTVTANPTPFGQRLLCAAVNGCADDSISESPSMQAIPDIGNSIKQAYSSELASLHCLLDGLNGSSRRLDWLINIAINRMLPVDALTGACLVRLRDDVYRLKRHASQVLAENQHHWAKVREAQPLLTQNLRHS